MPICYIFVHCPAFGRGSAPRSHIRVGTGAPGAAPAAPCGRRRCSARGHGSCAPARRSAGTPAAARRSPPGTARGGAASACRRARRSTPRRRGAGRLAAAAGRPVAAACSSTASGSATVATLGPLHSCPNMSSYQLGLNWRMYTSATAPATSLVFLMPSPQIILEPG